MVIMVVNTQSVGVYLALLILLGWFGPHCLYLGNWPKSLLYVVIMGTSLALPFAIVVAALLWLYDLFTCGRQVSAANNKLAAEFA
jgi:hypothetical protein